MNESPSKIEEWFASLPEEDIQREMDEWEERMREANIEYNKRREILDLKRRWREAYAVRAPAATDASKTEPTLFPERPSSIRESVLQVIASDPMKATWTASELKDALVERGWMTNDQKSMRSLQSALSRMQAEGKIARVRHGVYRSAALAAAQALSEEGSESD